MVVIGHSLGANATFDVVNALDRQNIPVELIVTFDATSPQPVPKNVLHFVNFYQENGFGKRVSPRPGFQGELTNIDLTADMGLSHTTIEKSPRLHAVVMQKIAAIVKKNISQKDGPQQGKTQPAQEQARDRPRRTDGRRQTLERFTSAVADNPCITRGQCGSLLLHVTDFPRLPFAGLPAHPSTALFNRRHTALSFDHFVGGDRNSLRPTVHWPTLIMLTTVVISSKALLWALPLSLVKSNASTFSCASSLLYGSCSGSIAPMRATPPPIVFEKLSAISS